MTCHNGLGEQLKMAKVGAARCASCWVVVTGLHSGSAPGMVGSWWAVLVKWATWSGVWWAAVVV
jgi:hypothetical protein